MPANAVITAEAHRGQGVAGVGFQMEGPEVSAVPGSLHRTNFLP